MRTKPPGPSPRCEQNPPRPSPRCEQNPPGPSPRCEQNPPGPSPICEPFAAKMLTSASLPSWSSNCSIPFNTNNQCYFIFNRLDNPFLRVTILKQIWFYYSIKLRNIPFVLLFVSTIFYTLLVCLSACINVKRLDKRWDISPKNVRQLQDVPRNMIVGK